jgi:hypothetical protein
MKLLAILLPLLCCLSVGQAAELRYGSLDPKDSEDNAVLLSGEIRKGDYEALLRFARKNPTIFNAHTLVLASPGGDLIEAMRIGSFVRKTYQSVFVSPDIGKCASACFLIYVAAVNRGAQAKAIGIHRPYFAPSEFERMPLQEAEKKHRRLMEVVRKYLEDQQVPQYLIERMFSLASTEIYWLTFEDLDNLGARANWWDQVLVARCGLDKKLEQGFSRMGESFARASEAKRHIRDLAICAYNISAEDRERNLRELLGARR